MNSVQVIVDIFSGLHEGGTATRGDFQPLMTSRHAVSKQNFGDILRPDDDAVAVNSPI